MRGRGTAAIVLALAACMHDAASDRSIVPSAPFEAQVASLGPTLRVVAFNVHEQPGETIARALSGDPALRGADLIVLEEVSSGRWCGAACVAAHALGLYAEYAPRSMLGGGTEGVAVLSRAPLESARVLELPSYAVPGGAARNAALVVTVQVGGRPVTVYAVHLTLRLSAAQRVHQMTAVLADARGRSTPVIIAGDFNDGPFSWVGGVVPLPRPREAARFEELVRAYGFATPATHVGATYRRPRVRIDAIYTRGFRAERVGTARGLAISDHLAVWAVLRLAPPGPRRLTGAPSPRAAPAAAVARARRARGGSAR